MFSCCAPGLPEEAQVALILHILCGFSVAEVAGAILSTEVATEKRISRAKESLASSGRLFDVHDDAELQKRLPVVQRAALSPLQRGYHGASPESIDAHHPSVEEALHLARMLLDHPACAVPSTRRRSTSPSCVSARGPHAGTARLRRRPHPASGARPHAVGCCAHGRGVGFPRHASATGDTLSEYHLEAAIGAVHANARSAARARWGEVVGLYDLLMGLRPSPGRRPQPRDRDRGERRARSPGLVAMRAMDRGDKDSDGRRSTRRRWGIWSGVRAGSTRRKRTFWQALVDEPAIRWRGASSRAGCADCGVTVDDACPRTRKADFESGARGSWRQSQVGHAARQYATPFAFRGPSAAPRPSRVRSVQGLAAVDGVAEDLRPPGSLRASGHHAPRQVAHRRAHRAGRDGMPCSPRRTETASAVQ